MIFAKPLGRDKDKPIGGKKPMSSMAAVLEAIKQEEAENPGSFTDTTAPTKTAHSLFLERQAERKRKREEVEAKKKEPFDPNEDLNASGDPYKTLFISRLSKEVTEEDLRREFAMYGHIEKLRIIRDLHTGKSKGYAFILYERERDMKAAYKDAEGIKILGKRILVDVERGRTVKGWKPMRLGGGLGGRPKPIQHVEVSTFMVGSGFR